MYDFVLLVTIIYSSTSVLEYTSIDKQAQYSLAITPTLA